MAVVNVNSWTEFLEAAAVSGDTVVCPENAVWDLAELEPEGHNAKIVIRANVDGKGTQIKNLVIESGLTSTNDAAFEFRGTSSSSKIEINDLHFLNGNVIGGTSGGFAIAQYTDLVKCTFSSMVHGTNYGFYYGSGKTLYRCALNLEFATANGFTFIGDGAEVEFLNAKISGSNVQGCILNASTGGTAGKIKNSYIILDTPQATTLTCNNAEWSVVRCNGANITSLASFTKANFCLGVDSDFPNVTTVGNGIKLVSENDLRDAAYLQSIGFPIGVDG